jgi:hypothetical protein
MVVSPEGSDERLMIAVHGTHAFLGLERRDGLFQFHSSDREAKDGTSFFVIGGQGTRVESRYVLDVGSAALVVEEWLRGESSALGVWERR